MRNKRYQKIKFKNQYIKQSQGLFLQSNQQIEYQQDIILMDKSSNTTENMIRKQRKARSSPVVTGKNFVGAWRCEQKLLYYVFVLYHADKFEATEVRRSQKLFAMMSQFIKTRTINQCRTQHHKYFKQHGSLQKIVQCSKYYPQFHVKYQQSKSRLEHLDFKTFFGVQFAFQEQSPQPMPTQNIHIKQQDQEYSSDGQKSKQEHICKLQPAIEQNRSNKASDTLNRQQLMFPHYSYWIIPTFYNDYMPHLYSIRNFDK